MYIIFALITLGIAVITLLFLPDCPDNARFLNPKQKTQAVDRVRVHQQGVRDSKFKWYQAREALLDLKVWLPGFTACALSVTNGALNAVSARSSNCFLPAMRITNEVYSYHPG